MFTLCTAHIAVNAQFCFHAFIDLDRGPSRTALFSSVTDPLYTTKYTLFFMMLVLGDIIVIYRCYLVWQKNILIVILPILLSLASAILAFMAVWATTHYPKARTAVFIINNASNWGTALFSLSLVANIYATSGIAYRIWSYERRSLKSQRENSYVAYRRSFKPIARIIVESGALNATFLIVYTAILDKRPLAISIMGDMAAPFVGVVFSLVIVRVALNSQREDGISRTVLTTINFAGRQGARSTITSGLDDTMTAHSRVLKFNHAHDISRPDFENGTELEDMTFKENSVSLSDVRRENRSNVDVMGV